MLKRTRTGPAETSRSPQTKLWDQPLLGPSPSRTIFQSFTIGDQDFPPSVDPSIWYVTRGLGSVKESMWADAWTATGTDPGGGTSSRTAIGDPNAPSTRWVFACSIVGPADRSPRPELSKLTRVPPSFSRGMTDTLAWQTVVIERPDPASDFAPVPNFRRYCRYPFT